jgi:hypothetical protein
VRFRGEQRDCDVTFQWTPHISYLATCVNTSQIAVVLNAGMSVRSNKAGNRNIGILTDSPMFAISHCLV